MTQETSEQLVLPTDISFHDEMSAVNDPRHALTVKHIFCLTGEMSFLLYGQTFSVKDTDGILLIAGQKLEVVEKTPDFSMKSVFFSERFMRMVIPHPQYGTQMLLSQMHDPVLRMTREEHDRALAVTEAIKERFNMRSHIFYYEVLKRTVQTAILDNFEFFSRSEGYGMQRISANQETFHRFITLLDQGDYRVHRNIDYYAEILHITPKYLSELSVKASGRPASHWIDFFTSNEVACLLQNGSIPIVEITEKLNFTSLSYFSHYVKSHFGLSPQEYRRKFNSGQ